MPQGQSRDWLELDLQVYELATMTFPAGLELSAEFETLCHPHVHELIAALRIELSSLPDIARRSVDDEATAAAEVG
jgi:hypothetical protein